MNELRCSLDSSVGVGSVDWNRIAIALLDWLLGYKFFYKECRYIDIVVDTRSDVDSRRNYETKNTRV